MGHHKKGKKKSHHSSGFGHSFKKGFKHGLFGVADVMTKAAPVVSLVNPEFGAVVGGVGELEKDGLAGIDSIGAKNPEKRYNKTQQGQF